MNTKPVYIDTCLFGSSSLSRVRDYSRVYGDKIGFEILAMFDLRDYEKALRDNLDVLQKHRISFHGPVYCVEHSAARGTAEYEESMRHVRLTYQYAQILRSSYFVMHLNNCRVDPAAKEQMLHNAKENYRELLELFGTIDCRVLIENTGTILQKNMLLDQREFTDFCRDMRCGVLIDIGHANANGWDLFKLIKDLRPQIRAYHLHNNDGMNDQHRRLHDGTIDFTPLLEKILTDTPEADLIIEYTRRTMDGPGLQEDIQEVLDARERRRGSCKSAKQIYKK